MLSGEKQLLKIAAVKFVNMPRFDELSVKNLYPRFKDDPEIMKFLPSQMPQGKHVDREYFFTVLNSVYEDRVTAMIAHANRVRFEGGQTGAQEDTVLVTDDWWQQLNAMPYLSRKLSYSIIIFHSIEKRGKTLHLLKQSAKPVQTGRKRKRHEVFDPANDEMHVDKEEAKHADSILAKQDGYKDVTAELKRSKRNKTPAGSNYE